MCINVVFGNTAITLLWINVCFNYSAKINVKYVLYEWLFVAQNLNKPYQQCAEISEHHYCRCFFILAMFQHLVEVCCKKKIIMILDLGFREERRGHIYCLFLIFKENSTSSEFKSVSHPPAMFWNVGAVVFNGRTTPPPQYVMESWNCWFQWKNKFKGLVKLL